MSLSIQTNLGALSAMKQMNINNNAMNTSLNRLSSGFRINTAADDAAGYAISAKMQGSLGVFQAAGQNALQATAMVKTADAGANEIENMLRRLQVLATQASSANNASDLNKLDAERIKLESAITKIAGGTEYNGIKLLNGTASSAGGSSTIVKSASANYASQGISSIDLSAAASTSQFSISYVEQSGTTAKFGSGDAIKIKEVYHYTTAGGAAATATRSQTITISSVPANGTQQVSFSQLGVSLNITANLTGQATSSAGAAVVGISAGNTGIDRTSTQASKGVVSISANSNPTATTNYTIKYVENGTAGSGFGNGDAIRLFSKSTATGAVSQSQTVTINTVPTSGATQTVNFSQLGVSLSIDGSIKGAKASAAGASVGQFTYRVDTSGGNLGQGSVFQIGLGNTSNDKVTASFNKSYKLNDLNGNIAGLDLTTQSNAQQYLTQVTTALNTLTSQRADLGSTINQLGFINANLATSIEQTTSAISTIKDANMAAEMTAFTKSQILVQAGTAMLAQAKSSAQNILSLFR